jgi:flagellar FliL protein
MSDQDDINLEGDEAAAGCRRSEKRVEVLFLSSLNGSRSSSARLVFIVTVVVVTVQHHGWCRKEPDGRSRLREYIGAREVFQWYTSVGSIQTGRKMPCPFRRRRACSGIHGGEDTPAELTSRLIELKDFLRSYFQNKTAAELRNEEKIKIELRNSINDNILSSSKIKDVRFTKYEIVEQ